MPHPLLAVLHGVRQESLASLEWLMTTKSLHHVATYVLCVAEDCLLVNVTPKSRKRAERRQVFGGCNSPQCLPRMINSLRLELVDEGGLMFPQKTSQQSAAASSATLQGHAQQSAPAESVFFSDLFVVKECLVQIVVLPCMPAVGLFSPEKARQTEYLLEDLEQARKAQPELVARTAAAYTVTQWPLASVRKELWKFRDADRETFEALEYNGLIAANMQTACEHFAGTKQQGHAQLHFLVGSDEQCTFVQQANHVGARVLSAAKEPWSPLMWQEARCLEEWDLFKCLVREDDEEGEAADVMARIGQGAQVMLWRAIAVKGTEKVVKALPAEPQPREDVKKNFDTWLQHRGLETRLRFDKVCNLKDKGGYPHSQGHAQHIVRPILRGPPPPPPTKKKKKKKGGRNQGGESWAARAIQSHR